MVFAFTSNLNVEGKSEERNQILVGGIPIEEIYHSDIKKTVGVIMDNNFFFSGTLEDNLKWKNYSYDEELAVELGRKLNLE